MDEENRDVILHFRVSQAELERIRRKMKEQGIHSMSACLRKMALDGYCALPFICLWKNGKFCGRIA